MSHIIEINGIKMAVDERTATLQRVDTFKIGDPVKLLLKSYSGFDVKFGVILGFDNFKAKPTLTIGYLEYHEMKFAYISQGCEHEILAVDGHDMAMDKVFVIDKMESRIKVKEQELADERMKLNHFKNTFGKYFEGGIPDQTKATV
jgi:hypothetical protein